MATESTVAISEHAIAAGEFATAAKDTENFEALRTLRLLEEHHKRLSSLLKSSSDPAACLAVSTDKIPGLPTVSSKDFNPSPEDNVPRSKQEGATRQRSPTPPVRNFHPARDLTSSIASNLASARGIRSRQGQAASPTLSKDQAPGSFDTKYRKDGTLSKSMTHSEMTNKPPLIPLSNSSASVPANEPIHTSRDRRPNEDGYFKFTNAFGNLVNVLSAPLAYAGLPLNPNEPTANPQSVEPTGGRRSKVKQTQSRTELAQPDINNIYSPAAINALGLKGTLATDSFYVVPTSGHTLSYANILSYAEKEKRRKEAHRGLGEIDNIIEEPEDDDFVDARESQAPLLSPAARSRVGKTQGEKDLHNAVEELYMENQNLKEMLDKVSMRLHAFEASAQSSGMALAESMRLMRSSSPGATSSGQSNVEVNRKKETERRLIEALNRIKELEKVNGRQEKALIKYRERWEKLKAGAKARREAYNSPEAMP